MKLPSIAEVERRIEIVKNLDIPYSVPSTVEILTELADATRALEDIQRVVDKQAEDEALWSAPLDRLQGIAEAYLQQELRGLHAVIEYHTKPPREVRP